MASMNANARIDVAIEMPSDEVGEKLPALMRVLPAGVESRLVTNEGAASVHISLVGAVAEVRNTVDEIANCIGVD